MSLNLNQVIIAGNLTRDPEIRTLTESRMVTHFTIANNRRWKGNDGVQHEEVNFIDCEAWARTAEMVGQYLTKGSPCIVIGRLKQDSWTDKEGGGKRTKLKVVVENVQFVSGRPKSDDSDTSDESAVSADLAPTSEPQRPPVRTQRNSAREAGPNSRRSTPHSTTAVADEPPF